jgi:nickel/cobalt transporter (NicO) family protein
MRSISRRWSGLGDFVQRAPYLSGIVMIGLGLYVGSDSWINVSIAF